ncbi:hypothetical protein AMAG_05909 [Allomyces macrogynus ATCC 38327]|uniref:G-protein coupled receptors family 3 profile domain-containing protein n=1 Tax=Allomyces macrogynus (strain ATCC 38327) TaxID=578462 RepID=A0A0L0SDB3_ALLM3|nr:hypothetical protein AMAG_05909 [Allomyces macrogynus ATCC 38327]|eukprot:KNE60528.1 hypothetical protein AMAG_05909 [Allomyces macrogynus ATCC 38327]
MSPASIARHAPSTLESGAVNSSLYVFVNRPSSSSKDQYLAISQFIYTGVNLVLGGFSDAATSVASINQLIADWLGIDYCGIPRNTQWNDPPSIVVAAIVAFLVVTIVFLAIRLFYSRDTAAARRIPAEFLVGILVGSLLGSVAPLTFIGTPTLQIYELRVILIGFGFTLMTSCMAAQDFRIYLIVSSPLRRVAADVNRILWQSLVAAWVPEGALIGLWLGLDPLAPFDVMVDNAWRVVVVHVVDAWILIVRSQPHGPVFSLRKLVSVSGPNTAARSFTATFAAGILEVWTRTESELQDWHARLAQTVPVGGQSTMHEPSGRGTHGSPAAAPHTKVTGSARRDEVGCGTSDGHV